MEQLKVLELFGGIGACTAALKRLGVNYEVVDYVEIDKYAVKSYNAINGTNFAPQDIREWDKAIEADLIMHGSPCQDFSIGGLNKGGDEGSGTRSSLMYETLRIVKKVKPKYVIWENVKNLLSEKHRHNFDKYIECMATFGYSSYYKVLNAKDYGVPQNRERVFTISILDGESAAFNFPSAAPLEKRLIDFLESEVDSKYYVKARMEKKETATRSGINCEQVGTLDIKGNDCIRRVYSAEGLCPTITTMTGGNRQPKVAIYKEYNNFYVIPRGSDGKLINGSYNRVWEKEKIVGALNVIKPIEIGERKEGGLIIRKLTPRECWRLMGFTDDEYEKAAEVNSAAQLYKQAGNSIVVNVLEAIFKELLATSEAAERKEERRSIRKIIDFFKGVKE